MYKHCNNNLVRCKTQLTDFTRTGLGIGLLPKLQKGLVTARTTPVRIIGSKIGIGGSMLAAMDTDKIFGTLFVSTEHIQSAVAIEYFYFKFRPPTRLRISHKQRFYCSSSKSTNFPRTNYSTRKKKTEKSFGSLNSYTLRRVIDK